MKAKCSRKKSNQVALAGNGLQPGPVVSNLGLDVPSKMLKKEVNYLLWGWDGPGVVGPNPAYYRPVIIHSSIMSYTFINYELPT